VFHVADVDPDLQREFAVEVVRRLREAGHEAYWAGGCVRDRLLGLTPKDYDVATAARPDEVVTLFGPRRTLGIGAAFGVIAVRGPHGAGQIEVATFRSDVGYSDGRHPDEVRFSDARHDAERRDFTINGLFFDPLDHREIDFVGGVADLQAGLVRAIGDPRARFTEDKLRMLRAVRFAAKFRFALDEATRGAIREMAGQVSVVSAERIAQEMRAMLVHPQRARAVELLRDVGLLVQLLPEVAALAEAPHDAADTNSSWPRTLRVLEELVEPSFSLAVAALVHRLGDSPGGARGHERAALVQRLGPRWKLSTADKERAAWLARNQEQLLEAAQRPWSQVQPVLIHEGAHELVALDEAIARVASTPAPHVAFCRAKLALSDAELDPPPLVTGEDLIARGVPAGPVYRRVLEQARAAQLDGEVRSREEALRLVDELLRG
jgi:tRNA nucleotidyltransferase/poly(A) polymerase